MIFDGSQWSIVMFGNFRWCQCCLLVMSDIWGGLLALNGVWLSLWGLLVLVILGDILWCLMMFGSIR